VRRSEVRECVVACIAWFRECVVACIAWLFQVLGERAKRARFSAR